MLLRPRGTGVVQNSELCKFTFSWMRNAEHESKLPSEDAQCGPSMKAAQQAFLAGQCDVRYAEPTQISFQQKQYADPQGSCKDIC